MRSTGRWYAETLAILPEVPAAGDNFLVARNPDERSTLPYLLRIPLDGGLALKARETWPRAARVYCHPLEEDWPLAAEIVDEVAVRHCARRGSAIDLVLDRVRNNRAQFVYTRLRGRQAIFWQTAKVVRQARPGVRVPARRAGGLRRLEIELDTRERYPYRFASRPVERTHTALPAGDYAVRGPDGRLLACVERKTLPDLATSLTDGTLNFAMAELAALPAAAVVVEDRYSSIFKLEHVEPGWLAELVARLAVRYPSVPIVWAESRKLAEEWTWRFLAVAAAELGHEDDPCIGRPQMTRR